MFFYILISYKYYHVFMKNWKKHVNSCIYSAETHICADQKFIMFQQNKISIYQVYAVFILKVCRIDILIILN